MKTGYRTGILSVQRKGIPNGGGAATVKLREPKRADILG